MDHQTDTTAAAPFSQARTVTATWHALSPHSASGLGTREGTQETYGKGERVNGAISKPLRWLFILGPKDEDFGVKKGTLYSLSVLPTEAVQGPGRQCGLPERDPEQQAHHLTQV